MRVASALLPLLLSVAPAAAQPLERGDVVVSSATSGAPSRILVYRNDGTFKRELASITPDIFRESLFQRNLLHVPTQPRVRIFDPNGTALPAIEVPLLVYLSPAADGSIVGASGSGELFHFNADGTLRYSRDTVILAEPRAHGVDLAADQCTLFANSGSAIVSWNICDNTSWRLVSPIMPFFGTALRVLPNGSFLMAYRTDVALLDSGGNTIRTYGIPGVSLALDVDRTSFWVGAGGSLLKVDIATGTILQNITVGEAVSFLSVVGEPRAALQASSIPTMQPLMIAILGVALLVLAMRALSFE